MKLRRALAAQALRGNRIAIGLQAHSGLRDSKESWQKIDCCEIPNKQSVRGKRKWALEAAS
jgi:hypothetical protein